MSPNKQKKLANVKKSKGKKKCLPAEIIRLKKLGFKLEAYGSSVYLLSRGERILVMLNEAEMFYSIIADSNSTREIPQITSVFKDQEFDSELSCGERSFIKKIKDWYLGNPHLLNPYMVLSKWHNAIISDHEQMNLSPHELDNFYRARLFKFAVDHNTAALFYSYNSCIKPTTDLLFKSKFIELRANSKEFVEINYLSGFVDLYHCEESQIDSPLQIDCEDSSIRFRQTKISADAFDKKISNLIKSNFAEIKLQALWSKSDLFKGELDASQI